MVHVRLCRVIVPSTATFGRLLLAIAGLVRLDAWAMAMYIVPYYYG